MPIAPNLLKQEFSAAGPNKVWLADITYLPTGEGWLYLAAVLDLATRKVVAHGLIIADASQASSTPGADHGLSPGSEGLGSE